MTDSAERLRAYLLLLSRFGLSEEEVGRLHWSGPVPDEASTQQVVANVIEEDDRAPEPLYNYAHRLLAASSKGIELDREYTHDDVEAALTELFEPYDTTVSISGSDGVDLGGPGPDEPIDVQVTDATGEVRSVTFGYPDRPLEDDNLPALLHEVETELLGDTGMTFALLTERDASWRAVFLSEDRLDALQTEYGERIEFMGEPLLEEDQPDDYAEPLTQESGGILAEEGGDTPDWLSGDDTGDAFADVGFESAEPEDRTEEETKTVEEEGIEEAFADMEIEAGGAEATAEETADVEDLVGEEAGAEPAETAGTSGRVDWADDATTDAVEPPAEGAPSETAEGASTAEPTPEDASAGGGGAGSVETAPGDATEAPPEPSVVPGDDPAPATSAIDVTPGEEPTPAIGAIDVTPGSSPEPAIGRLRVTPAETTTPAIEPIAVVPGSDPEPAIVAVTTPPDVLPTDEEAVPAVDRIGVTPSDDPEPAVAPIAVTPADDPTPIVEPAPTAPSVTPAEEPTPAVSEVEVTPGEEPESTVDEVEVTPGDEPEPAVDPAPASADEAEAATPGAAEGLAPDVAPAEDPDPAVQPANASADGETEAGGDTEALADAEAGAPEAEAPEAGASVTPTEEEPTPAVTEAETGGPEARAETGADEAEAASKGPVGRFVAWLKGLF